MKAIGTLTQLVIFFMLLFFAPLKAQRNIEKSTSSICNRVVSNVEDPTPAQVTGASAPVIISTLTWIRPAISVSRVAFSGTAGSAASHEGVDYVNGDQSVSEVVVRAAADGKVLYVREGCDQSSMFAHNNTTREAGAGWGNHIVLSHKNAIYTRYGHLLKNSIKVNNGDSVKAGQIIATMGNSGRSELRHLHFELGTKTTAFDPCAMSQNFDYVFNSEILNFSVYNNQITLNSPTNNKDSVSMNAVLVWEKDINSTSYTVEIATDAACSQMVRTATGADNFYKISFLSPGNYFWRVKSDKVNYSEIRNFKIISSEGFENCLKDGLPTNWRRFAENVTNGTITNENAWVATNIDRHNSGQFSVRMGNYMSVSDCWLVTPKLAIISSDKNLIFNWSNTAGDYGSVLEIYVSESAAQPTTSTSFTKIKTITEGTDGNWHTENLDLTSLVGKQIFVGFKVHNFGNSTNVNAGGDNWWIDDVTFTNQVSSSLSGIKNDKNELIVFPNPVGEFAKISFLLDRNSAVKIDLLNVTGKIIQQLENNNLTAGKQVINWNSYTKKVPNGIYFVRIITDESTSLTKIIKL